MVDIRESAESDALALNEEIKPASHYKLTSYRGALNYAMELAAHEALQRLQDDHDIATIDYNWYETENIRDNSGELVHRIAKQEHVRLRALIVPIRAKRSKIGIRSMPDGQSLHY
jgi:hypothetical protein